MAGKKQGFLQGALVLLCAVAIVKVLGAIFKIPLNLIIGDVGMGYFGTAYAIYTPIFSLATAGFPVAIARLVSENSTLGRWRDVRRLHRASVPIFLTLGVAAFCLMLFGAQPYLQFANKTDIHALPAIYVLAPAVLFSSLTAIYRGYYEGLRNMWPTAVSEVVEAAFKLLLGLCAAFFVLRYGMGEFAAAGTVFGVAMQSEAYAAAAVLPYAAAGAIGGVTVGSFFGFVFLILYHKIKGDGITARMLSLSPAPMPLRRTMTLLARNAVPVALGAMAVSLSTLVDTTLLQNRVGDIMAESSEVLLRMYGPFLKAVDIEQQRVPTALFGCYTNALTLFMLVPAVTQAFAVSALPSVTAAWASKDRRRLAENISAVLRASAMFTLPAGLGLAAFSGPLTSLLGYSAITGRVLSVLGFASVFAAMNVPVTSMLQAVGRADIPVKLLGAALAMKIALNYVLVGIPEVNIMGAGVGTLCCYAFLTFAGLLCLRRETGVKLCFGVLFGGLFAASVLSVGLAWGVRNGAVLLFAPKAATLIAMLFAGGFYLVFLLKMRVIRKDEVILLRNGRKIAKILENHNWIG